MATLPIFDLEIAFSIYGIPDSGVLEYVYKPFRNLNGENGLEDLRLLTSEAKLNIRDSDESFVPIELDTEPAYDGSINLIFTDRQNIPRLINSRFYLTSSSTYKIADRKGNIDTNIYSRDNFINETSLVKRVGSVVKLDYLGIYDGGKMPVGNYTFYFRLADADDNMTDFISESGKVVCHIGGVNNPKTIRGGQQSENSEKIIKFKLKNLDQAYQYIRVYYTKTSGNDEVETKETYFIYDKFKILGEETIITITGYEAHIKIGDAEINTQYASFETVKSITKVQNMTFVGNIKNNYELFSWLEETSLRIVPKLVNTASIGRLDGQYNEMYNQVEGHEYFNTKNIYYKLGYWDQEIYRFGIVYILNDYSLSPVFNIRGVNNLNKDYNFHAFKDKEVIPDENYIVFKNGDIEENSKGVVKIDATGLDTILNYSQIKTLGLEFMFEGVNNNEYVDIINGINGNPGLKQLTKGFFIVRQKRIPSILAQSVGIATSKKARIPILKSQSNNSFFIESFLTTVRGRPKLGRSLQYITSTDLILNNALLCPEAHLRTKLFNTFFTSAEFKVIPANFRGNTYFTRDATDTNLFTLKGLYSTPTVDIVAEDTKITLIEPGIELLGDGTHKFSSKAGNSLEAWKHADPYYGDIEDISEDSKVASSTLNNSAIKIRGEFNTYLGTSSNKIRFGQYYNIYQKGYDFTNFWREYFRVRFNDTSPFMPISDRHEWSDLKSVTSVDGYGYSTSSMYRGDCYINTYSHRMNWNFIDHELPTNTKIVDPYTWFRNFKVKAVSMVVNKEGIAVGNNEQSSLSADSQDQDDNTLTGESTYTYKKVLPIFTFKLNKLSDLYNDIDKGSNKDLSKARILVPEDRRFSKYSVANGTFGFDKLNRPDVNAVPLGHWATFKICSSINTAFRDIDFSNVEEEALHKTKRSFYPLQSSDNTNKLPESKVINVGISKTLGNKYYMEIPDVPFIKTDFTNRIYHSNLLVDTAFQNGNRVFEANNYMDYTMEYGALVKLVEWYGKLIAVMEHGVLFIPVNERALATNAQGQNVYINTDTVLPKNPGVLSNTFGTLWPDSVVKTSRYIYGVDTVGKKIWRTDGESKFELISDMKIQKFLNDNIFLKHSDLKNFVGTHFVKSHYNAFKQDILFVFKYEEKEWHLCWNELLEKWVTRYTWFPEFSENINNIFYTFANQVKHSLATNKLYKHGFAGGDEELVRIRHTKWYEEQQKFEFEFVVNGVPGVQKIFNNLKIISNKAQPYAFDYEVVGEGYEWHMYKDIVCWLNNNPYYNLGFEADDFVFMINEDGSYQIQESTWQDKLNQLLLGYEYLLTTPLSQIKATWKSFPMPKWIPEEKWDTYILTKLPFVPKSRTPSPLDGVDWDNFNTRTVFINDPWNGEDRVVSNQDGLNLSSVGRVKGNMKYVEDSWDIQIQPIKIRYAYMKNGILVFSKTNEMKVRDKYIKIRVRYDGTRHALINALRTLYTLSYA